MTKIRYPLESMLSLLENAVLVEKVLSLGKLRISLVLVISGTLFSRKYLQDCHPNL